MFCKAPRADAIERHWVGIEECLLDYIQKRQNLLSVPFDVDHMLRLEDAPAPAPSRGTESSACCGLCRCRSDGAVTTSGS